MISLISVLSFRIAAVAAIAKIAAKTVARHSAGWKTIRWPLKNLPSVFECVFSCFFFFRFQFALFFSNPCTLNISIQQKCIARQSVPRYNFTSSHVFIKSLRSQRWTEKSAIAVWKQLLYDLEYGRRDVNWRPASIKKVQQRRWTR